MVQKSCENNYIHVFPGLQCLPRGVALFGKDLHSSTQVRILLDCPLSNFQLSVESNLGLLWFFFNFLCDDLKIRSIFLTNKTPNENQSRLGRPRFPAVLEDGLFLL